eukprot:m.80246 g.80246  ORF g.80246 m.80246 type:complete len:294 (+) comp19362_c0_seq1:353-1234(+)
MVDRMAVVHLERSQQVRCRDLQGVTARLEAVRSRCADLESRQPLPAMVPAVASAAGLDRRPTTLSAPLQSVITDGRRKERRRVIVVMGGAFNPVHSGHVQALIAAKTALEADGATVVSGHFAVATAGYVNHKCKGESAGEAIPVSDRLALCNAVAAATKWIAPTDKPYGSANELAKSLVFKDPTLETVIVGGSDKLKSGRKQKRIGAAAAHQKKKVATKMYVCRGDQHGSAGVLKAVMPGLSSTAIRNRLRVAPGITTVRAMMAEGTLPVAVGLEIEARIGTLRATTPKLFMA